MIAQFSYCVAPFDSLPIAHGWNRSVVARTDSRSMGCVCGGVGRLGARRVRLHDLHLRHRECEQGVRRLPTAVAGSLTLTLLVRLAGGVIAGWIADRWGRRLPLMLSLLWFAAFDAAIYFAPSFAWLLVLRTLFGFGMGAEWTAGTALAMESLPPRCRRIASGLLQAGWPIGFLLAAALASWIVPAYGWRAMFLIAAVPALAVLPIRLLVPDDGARAKPREKSRGDAERSRAPAVRTMLVLGSLVMALGFVVYYGMTTSYIGMQVEHAGCAASDGACLAGPRRSAGVASSTSTSACSSVWSPRAGSRTGSGVIAALVTPALLMVPALPLFVGAWPHAAMLGAFLGGALGVGYSGVTPVLTTSLFAEHVRARAIGIVYHVGALLAAFVPTLVPALAHATGLSLATTVELVVGTRPRRACPRAVLALRNATRAEVGRPLRLLLPRLRTKAFANRLLELVELAPHRGDRRAPRSGSGSGGVVATAGIGSGGGAA